MTTKLAFNQIDGNTINVKDYGAVGDGVTDDTSSWDTLEATLSDGDTVIFPTGTYKGVFHTKKAINFKFEGNAKLTNSTSGDIVFKVGPNIADFTQYNVTESTLNNGDTQFTVTGASTNFAVGDIGYLYDGSERPSDSQDVNLEMVKIKSISTNTVTVEGIIHAHKGTSSIVFYHSTYQPKNVKIENLYVEPDNTHTVAASRVIGIDGVTLLDTKTNNTTGDAVSVRNCYNVKVERTDVGTPRVTTSGLGYGVALYNVTHATVKKVVGNGCRHVFDADSTYQFYYEDISDMNDQSSPVIIGHNGFTSYGIIKNIKCKTTQYPVSTSDGGFGGGALNASKSDHPLRMVEIEDVHSIVDSSIAPDTNTTLGVYLRNNLDGVSIDNIRVQFTNATALTSSGQSVAVRIDGVAVGSFSVKNISANSIGRFVFSNGARDSATVNKQNTIIEGLTAENCNTPIFLQGIWHVSIDKIAIDSVLGSQMIKLEATGGDSPAYLDVGSSINYGGSDVQIYDITSNIDGNVKQLGRSVGSSVSVTASYNITATEVQNRGNYVRLVSPVGAGSINMGDFPEPYVNGQKITVNGYNSGRQDIVIPGTISTIDSDITFDSSTPTHNMVAYGGVWRKEA